MAAAAAAPPESLSHYSRDGALMLNALPRGNRDGRATFYGKPAGLWVSVDGHDDWPHWCAAEEFSIGAYRYRVTLAPGANILRLTCAADLDEFTAAYGVPDALHTSCLAIDWDRVALPYQGLLIAPYVWQRRFELMWYYGWDCASGVIWDRSAIESVCLIESADDAHSSSAST